MAVVSLHLGFYSNKKSYRNINIKTKLQHKKLQILRSKQTVVLLLYLSVSSQYSLAAAVQSFPGNSLVFAVARWSKLGLELGIPLVTGRHVRLC